MVSHSLVKGQKHTDDRGSISFLNSLDLTEVVRMYEIAPINEKLIRGWQAHQYEKKWFYCTQGSFIINLIKVDDFEHPRKELTATKVVLSANEPNVLNLTGGYATAIKSLEANSKLLIFSDFTLEQSKNDDFRFDINFWKAQWNK